MRPECLFIVQIIHILALKVLAHFSSESSPFWSQQPWQHVHFFDISLNLGKIL